MTNLAGQLHDKLGNLSDAQRNAALSTIFGTDAMRAASVLMKEGSTGIQKWIKDVNDQGFAAAQAAGKMNSLQGDFKKLQAAVETGLIGMGAQADGFLRPVVQGITDAVRAFNNLPEPIKGGTLAVSGLAGAGLLLGGMLLTTIPKIYESVKAVQALELAAPKAAGALQTLGKGAAVITAVMGAIGIAGSVMDANSAHAKSAAESAQSLISLNVAGAKTNEIFSKDFFSNANRKFGLFQENDINGIGEAMKRVSSLNFGDTMDDAFSWIPGSNYQVKELRKSISNVDDALANFSTSGSSQLAAETFHKIAVTADKQGISLAQTAKQFPQYMDSLRKYASDMKVALTDQELLDLAVGRIPQKMKDAQNSTEGAAKATELPAKASAEQAKALADVGLAADGTTVDLDKLVTAMEAAGLIQLSANDALRNYYASLDAVDASIKQNGKTLDIHTEKGRANQKALDDVAAASLNLVKANAKNGDSQEELSKNLHTGYNDLLANYAAFGITGDAADTMARKALGIPKDVNIDTAIQNYADSMAKLNGIRQGVEAIRDYKEVAIHVKYTESGAAIRDRASDAGGAGAAYQVSAKGGPVNGSGPKGVDSERFLLAPGEYVLSDRDVDAMGGQAAVSAFRQQLHSGGGVRPTYAAPAPAAQVISSSGGVGDLTVYVTNPFTGEEVQGIVRSVARGQVEAGINAANQDASRRPAR